MKLLKPTWVNHNGECARGSRGAEPGDGPLSGARWEPHAGLPASLRCRVPGARAAGPAVADFVLARGDREPGTCSATSALAPALAPSPRPPACGPGRVSGPGLRPGCARTFQCVKLERSGLSVPGCRPGMGTSCHARGAGSGDSALGGVP